MCPGRLVLGGRGQVAGTVVVVGSLVGRWWGGGAGGAGDGAGVVVLFDN
jgi:hypothetical protein